MTCQVTKIGDMGNKIISHQKLLPSNVEPGKKERKNNDIKKEKKN